MQVENENVPAPGDGACRLLVGTGGHAFTEWVAAGFYPPDTRADRMLPLYARRFPATELNATWYRMPTAAAIDRQRRQAPPEFQFAAKLNRSLTHGAESRFHRRDAVRFREGVAPLIQAGQLCAVLIQLPSGLERTAATRQHLAHLLDALEGLPLAVEFRHRSWVSDRVLGELERRRVSLVCVDAPVPADGFPPLACVTNPELFYVRFHGRNARGWRSGHLRMQFDYRYTDDELQCWVEERIIPMSRRARTGAIFFNNHVNAQAPADARRLIDMLAARGFDAAGGHRP
jgi:uncharacterized protein YecE (DUF72 family)